MIEIDANKILVENLVIDKQKKDSTLNAITDLFTRYACEVQVGINSNLINNQVSIFDDDIIGAIKYGDRFQIQNHLNSYKLSAELHVIDIIQRKHDSSSAKANVFISKEMARLLGITPDMYNRGVFHMKIININN